MKIDVAPILKEPGASLQFNVKGSVGGPVGLTGETDLSGPLQVRGVATSLGDDVYVEASVRGSVRLTCSRCLAPFEKPIDLSCEGKFVEDAEAPGAEGENEVDVFSLEGTFCDLDEMILHEVALSLPMKPLCKEDCKGLCPTCGRNLNEGDCDCPKPEESSSQFGRRLLLGMDERSKKDGRP